MALVTVDGGGGYWHPHPGDDPLGMVLYELIPDDARPRTRTTTAPDWVHGKFLWAATERSCSPNIFPAFFRAAAAISPAIFQSWGHVH
jgi:hypothetical protein